jgi:hypothetical protein
MYPNCARKNVLMPYPNTNGRWFNGALDNEVITNLAHLGLKKVSDSDAALENEVKLESQILSDSNKDDKKSTWDDGPPRIMAQFYKAGNHGTCAALRKSMMNDYGCTPSGKLAAKHKFKDYSQGYRQATFCPCPGGDSPSAKRMFDALLAGCIPVVLSHDFVWPFTKEFDRSATGNSSAVTSISGEIGSTTMLFGEDNGSGKIDVLVPNDFSIRLQVSDHIEPKFTEKLCQRISKGVAANQTDLQSMLDSVPTEELLRLKQGVRRAAYAYSYYKKRQDLPDNPMKEGILPDGGAAHILVRALGERAEGKLWPECERELKSKNPAQDKVHKFRC